MHAFETLAACFAMPLVVLAATHCGGKATAGHPSPGDATSRGGVGSSAGASAQGGQVAAGSAMVGGSNAIGGEGSIGGGITIPIGGAAATDDCNTLSNDAPGIALTIVADDAPLPRGGRISNGIYHLTQLEDFVGPGGVSPGTPLRFSSVIAISSSTDDSAELQLLWTDLSGELPIPVRQNQTLLIAGVGYAYSVTCDTRDSSFQSGSVFFTATNTQLVLIFPPTGGVTSVETFTHQ